MAALNDKRSLTFVILREGWERWLLVCAELWPAAGNVVNTGCVDAQAGAGDRYDDLHLRTEVQVDISNLCPAPTDEYPTLLTPVEQATRSAAQPRLSSAAQDAQKSERAYCPACTVGRLPAP